jgi:hypothetical protein
VYTQGWNEDRKILMKMVEVYKEVQYIQKRGHNKFHNYKYATEADVNEKVRDELSKRNVIMMPGVVNKELRNTTTKSGNTEYIYRVDMEFNFMDAETGESLVVPMSGEGQDVGDKAIFKAISGCQKYALMKAFMIPTGDDPEGDEGVDERNHKEPAQYRQPSGQGERTSQHAASSQSPNKTSTSLNNKSRAINLMNEMKWDWNALGSFASDVLGRKIGKVLQDIKSEEEWKRVADAMDISKAAAAI